MLEKIHLMITPATVAVMKIMLQKEEEDKPRKKRPRSIDKDSKLKLKPRLKQKLNWPKLKKRKPKKEL